MDGKDILRGCIGTFASDKLSSNLVKYALIAGLHDTRFPPIQIKELPFLSCSISLLTDFEEIENPLDWDIDVHGIEIDFMNGGEEALRRFRETLQRHLSPRCGEEARLEQCGDPGTSVCEGWI